MRLCGRTISGSWKYVDGQLYDLSADISETTNLAAKQPDRCKAIAARLKELISTG